MPLHLKKIETQNQKQTNTTKLTYNELEITTVLPVKFYYFWFVYYQQSQFWIPRVAS